MESWAIKRPFPCWMCGGRTIKMKDTYTRWCPDCDVRELRIRKGYFVGGFSEKVSPDGWPYLDHSKGYYPCP